MSAVRLRTSSSVLPWLQFPSNYTTISLIPGDGQSSVPIEASILFATSSFLQRLFNSVSISSCDDQFVFIPFTTLSVLQQVKDILSLGVSSTSVTQDTVTEIQQVLDVLEIKASVSLYTYMTCNQYHGHHDVTIKSNVPDVLLAQDQNYSEGGMNPGVRMNSSHPNPSTALAVNPGMEYWLQDEILDETRTNEFRDSNCSEITNTRSINISMAEKSSAYLIPKKEFLRRNSIVLKAKEVDARSPRFQEESSQSLWKEMSGTDRNVLLNYVIKKSKWFQCELCGKTGSRKDNLLNHVENKHFPGKFFHKCKVCLMVFQTKKSLQNHFFRKY